MSEMKRAYTQTTDAIELFRQGITEHCRADSYQNMCNMLHQRANLHIDTAIHMVLDALDLSHNYDADVWATLLDTNKPVDDTVAMLFDLKAVNR